MKLSIGILIALIAAWFGLKNTAYNMWMTRGAVEIPAALDYTTAQSWASQPTETPSGAWETPWGVDIFMVYPSPRLASPHGLIDPEVALAHPSHARLQDEILKALPTDASLYVPKYRMISNAERPDTLTRLVADDLSAAFDAYLANANRGRGVMLVVIGDTHEAIDPLLDRLQMDDLQHRFAGLIHIAPSPSQEPDRYDTLMCSPGLERACFQAVEVETQHSLMEHLFARLPNMRPDFVILDAEGVAAAIAAQTAQVTYWLDTYGPKPAEPLFGFEAIETAPIYRPGEDQPLPTAPDE